MLVELRFYPLWGFAKAGEWLHLLSWQCTTNNPFVDARDRH